MLLEDSIKQISPPEVLGIPIIEQSKILSTLQIQVPEEDSEDDFAYRLKPFQNDLTAAQSSYNNNNSNSNTNQRNKIPGSMYSPHVSPRRTDGTGTGGTRDFSPTDTPSVLSLQSQEYLYSVAQLVAHSGIRSPQQILPQSPPRPRTKSVPSIRPDGLSDHNNELSGDRVDQLDAAARLLERDLASKPDEFSDAFHHDYRANENYDLRFSEKSNHNVLSSDNLKEYQYQSSRPQPSPKVPNVETYDSKSGRRLSLLSIPSPAIIVKSYLEQHLSSPKFSSERSKSNTRRLSERSKGAPLLPSEYLKEKMNKIVIETEKTECEIDFESEKDEFCASESEGYSAKYVSQSQDSQQSKEAEVFRNNKENFSRNNSTIDKNLRDLIKIPDGVQGQTSDSSQCVPPQKDERVKSRTGSSTSQSVFPSSSQHRARELSSNGVKVVERILPMA